MRTIVLFMAVTAAAALSILARADDVYEVEIDFNRRVTMRDGVEELGKTTRMQAAEQTIHHDGDHPSHVVLPIIRDR